MNVKVFAPSPELKSYIKQYVYYNIEKQLIPRNLKFIPSGKSFMIFNFGDPFLIYNQAHCKWLLQTGNIIVGQQDAYYLLSPGKELIQFCIVFHPTGFYRLFNQTISELVNKSAPLEFLINHEIFPRIGDMRAEKINPELIANELNNFFWKQFLFAKRKYSFIEYSIGLINSRNGIITIKELANISNTCERNYRRRFVEIVGISPKKYIQLIRLQSIFQSTKIRLLKKSIGVI